MNRNSIAFPDLQVRIHHLWDQQWFLLTAGDFERRRYNTMTVSWGSLGIIWNRPFAQVLVRPTRHTWSFLEEHDSFTLCAFPRERRSVLEMLGSRSGREGDKVADSGLTLIPSTRVAAPGFAEAELILECRKIYWDDLDPSRFLAPAIEENYPERDYHRIYFGGIEAIFGTPKFAGGQ